MTLRKTGTRFYGPLLILILLIASAEDTRAQSLTISDATIQQASLNGHAGLAAAVQRSRSQKPCDPKRRALTGAAVGFVMGMVVVRRVTAEYDATVDAKGTLAAGGYGAALGAYVGWRTCR